MFFDVEYPRGTRRNFESKLTNQQAAAILQLRITKDRGGEFERELLRDYIRWGDRLFAWRMSWLHFIATGEKDKCDGAAQEAAVTLAGSQGDGLDGERLMSLFARVKATGLKTPSVYLAIENGTEQIDVELSMAPDSGRNPGCLYVKVGGDYAGKVTPNGRYEHSHRSLFGRDKLPQLIELLNRFSLDPETVAKQYGRITGRCCFCHLKLSNRVSIYNGYGPVCAEHYGLPIVNPPADWHPSVVVNEAVENNADVK